MQPPLSAAALVEMFKTLGVVIAVNPDAGEDVQVLDLAHGLIGTAELHAMRAEQAAAAAGASVVEFGEATAQAFNGAGCRTPADDLQLLSWEATRHCQRIGAHAAAADGGDQLIKTIQMTAGALSGLLNVALVMQNPLRGDGETSDAAALLGKAITALEQAAERAGGQRFVADLLDLTD